MFLYEKSQVRPEPVFVVDPTRTRLLDSSRAFLAPIRVLRRDGTEVHRDLTAVTFYFWNAGRAPIRREHILKPLLITLTDSTSAILDFSLLSVSRDVTRLRVLPLSTSPHLGRTLRLDFQILEQGDGGVGQILYEGNPAASLTIDGVVEGAKQVTTPATVGGGVQVGRILFGLAFLALAFVGIIILALAAAMVEQLLSRIIPALISKWIPWTLLGLFLIAFLYVFARPSGTDTLLDRVPKSIRIHH